MISIHVDPSAALAYLTNAQDKQVPFAMSKTLNRLANDGQKAAREGLKARFKLRRSEFNLRGIKISKEDRANKNTWRVVIQVDARTNYFNKFEEGGDKVPVGGHNYLWEPNEKVFKNRILPTADPLRPKNLHLHKDDHGRIVGDSRTFLAKTGNAEMPYVVVQRRDAHRGFTKSSIKSLTLHNFAGGMGPNRSMERKGLKAKKRNDGTVTLYKLRKRIHVKAQLEFIPTVRQTVQSRFRATFDEELAAAMKTARR